MAVLASTYTAVLKHREEIAEGTMALHLEKPSGFEFRPGQSIDLTLINPPESDSQGNSRAFSIASAPCEKDLLIATSQPVPV
jgi:ferredoxin-NADP reductase